MGTAVTIGVGRVRNGPTVSVANGIGMDTGPNVGVGSGAESGVGVGVSVGLAIAVAVISATTVARISGACVGLAGAWTTATGSGPAEDPGSSHAISKVVVRDIRATSHQWRTEPHLFHIPVVFTQALLGIYSARANIAQR